MKSNARFLVSTLLFFIFFSLTTAHAQQITILQQGTPTSIRGLSVVDDSIAWISGSKGYIALTKNGGKNWARQQVKGFEKADFRDIEAFSDKEAIIMSSGTPALVLKTIDGGATWKVKYKNTDTAYFFDAMDFADKKHGYILGDPINNKFVLMETKDQGETWNMFENRPDALPGEAAFAASGTCLRTSKYQAVIVSGGTKSRILTYFVNDNKWDYWQLPVKQGKASQGTFSFAASTNFENKVFVGGDYSSDKLTDSAAANIQVIIALSIQLKSNLLVINRALSIFLPKLSYQPALPAAILPPTAVKLGSKLTAQAITYAARQSVENWYC